MLLTSSRSRHNHNTSLGSPGSHHHQAHAHHRHAQHQQHPSHHHHGSDNEISPDNKYAKQMRQSGHGHGVVERMSCAARLQCWSWMLCGIICAFLSIDYAMRAIFPSTAGTGTAAGNAPSTIRNALQTTIDTGGGLDSILTPLIQSTTTTASTTSTNIRPTSLDDGYRFDNLAFVKPDPTQHAILIPYRDRSFHLAMFLEYMGPYLQAHFPHAHFTLWVVEQDDQELFNRAWLANVGLREIVKQQPTTSCVIFHDVDLVPNMTSHVPYTTCRYPTQLGSELQHFNWSVPYPSYCGGITSLSLKHWQLINGLGNDYIGWGGEDDDLYHRLRQNGLLFQPTGENNKNAAPVPYRPPKGRGIFRTISQKAEHHEQKKTHNNYWKTLELLKEMHENSERWKFDGMSDVYYTVTHTQQTQLELGFELYNHLKVIPQKLRDGSIHYGANANAIQSGTPTPAPNNNNDGPLAPLEFVHVPYTGGQAITKAAAQSGIVWGACHYGVFPEWACPPGISGDHQYAPMQFKASYQQALKPWLIPLMRFLENPLEGTKRFTVVRHPYSRAISFYRYTYDAQHGHPHGFKYHELVDDRNHPPEYIATYLREREHPGKLNAFLQDFLIRAHHPHRPDGIELIPQVQFVYHRGVKYVHHVLHYEFLQRDFKNILEKYQMVDAIELPPPERKRKRKKQVVKKYEEKRIPQVTWMTGQTFLTPLYQLLGMTDNRPRLVDMALSEIEDEYLLGAQDLEDDTIAMLNSHFEMDFRKFHYAKIKVNATTDAYWNAIQVIPRDSGVAKQQNDRNMALNKQKGGGASPPKDEQQQKQDEKDKERTEQVKDMIRRGETTAPKSGEGNEKGEADAAKEGAEGASRSRTKEEGEDGASGGGTKEGEEPDEKRKDDPYFQERKRRIEERLKAREPQEYDKLLEKVDNTPNEKVGKYKKLSKAMVNMREIAQKIREKDEKKEKK